MQLVSVFTSFHLSRVTVRESGVMEPLEPLRGLEGLRAVFSPSRAGLQCPGPGGRLLGQKEPSDPIEGLEVTMSCPRLSGRGRAGSLIPVLDVIGGCGRGRTLPRHPRQVTFSLGLNFPVLIPEAPFLQLRPFVIGGDVLDDREERALGVR